jgi:hypothetical protein
LRLACTKLRSILLLSIPLVSACANLLDLGGNGDDSESSPTEPAPPGAEKTSSALADYCAARTSWETTHACVHDACTAEQSKACAATYSVYRAEYLVALTQCGFTCDTSDAWLTREQCVDAKKDAIAPTSLQIALANDLCAVCPRAAGACLDDFFRHGEHLDNGAVSVGGPGASYDMLAEPIVKRVQGNCVQAAKSAGTSSCWPAFYHCVEQEVAASQPPSVASACAANAPPAVGLPPAAPPGTPKDAGAD